MAGVSKTRSFSRSPDVSEALTSSSDNLGRERARECFVGLAVSYLLLVHVQDRSCGLKKLKPSMGVLSARAHTTEETHEINVVRPLVD